MSMGFDMARLMELYGRGSDVARPSVEYAHDPDAWLVAFRDAYGTDNDMFNTMTHGLGPIMVKCIINRCEVVLFSSCCMTEIHFF